MQRWQPIRQVLLACCKPLLITPPCSSGEHLLKPFLVQTIPFRGVGYLSSQGLNGGREFHEQPYQHTWANRSFWQPSSNKKEQVTPSSTAASVCNACFLAHWDNTAMSLLPSVTRHKDASVPLLLPLYHSITSLAPIIPPQKDQTMRRKPATLLNVVCQSTSVMAVIHSIKIVNPKGRYSPLELFSTTSAPWWSELGKQLKDDICEFNLHLFCDLHSYSTAQLLISLVQDLHLSIVFEIYHWYRYLIASLYC